MVNDIRFKEFEKSNLVHITNDGRVLANNIELKPLRNR
jgi:hypothetical protein